MYVNCHLVLHHIKSKTFMKAIQATGKIDAEGQLSLDKPIQVTVPSSVRVIILFAESEADTTEFSQNISEYQQRHLMSSKELAQELKQALTEAGYDSREKIIDLVQEVKREIINSFGNTSLNL
nr:hypothetical protein [Gloeotrichia echinulata DEX184]